MSLKQLLILLILMISINCLGQTLKVDSTLKVDEIIERVDTLPVLILYSDTTLSDGTFILWDTTSQIISYRSYDTQTHWLFGYLIRTSSAHVSRETKVVVNRHTSIDYYTHKFVPLTSKGYVIWTAKEIPRLPDMTQILSNPYYPNFTFKP